MNEKTTSKSIAKLIFCMFYDFAIDLTIGSIPVVDTFIDVLGIVIAYSFYGAEGLLVSWELIEITGQIDRFVPSLTIVGIADLFREVKEK